MKCRVVEHTRTRRNERPPFQGHKPITPCVGAPYSHRRTRILSRVCGGRVRYVLIMAQDYARRPEPFGQYQLKRLIATGGMAEIFEARKQGAHGFTRRVAIKRILPALRMDPRFQEMFCEEARIQAGLAHPNIVEVLDFGQVDGRLFMALEYVDGLTCSDLIDRLLKRRRTVDLAAVLYILREVLRGLAFLHSACDLWGRPLELVHRDIAPNNVLISKVGQVKIADFGIYYSRHAARHTVPGELKGKLGYASPEQARGDQVDGRSDLFSLSVMAAEMLIGKALFQGDTVFDVFDALNRGDLTMLHAHGEHVPDDVKQVLGRALHPDPARRYDNATTFGMDVQWLMQRHGLEMESYDFTEWLADLGLIAVQSGVSMIPPTRKT